MGAFISSATGTRKAIASYKDVREPAAIAFISVAILG
jgi:hypothetical protein